MKRFLSLWMFLLCFIGGVFADDSYTITFKETGSSSDGSTAVTKVADMIQEGASYVKEISASSKVYQARTGRGLKLGTSSAAGSFTMDLMNPVKPTKIEFKARKYNDTEISITVNGKTVEDLSGDFSTYLVDYDGNTEISKIEVSTPAKRAYITEVTVYFADAPAPGPQKAEGALIDYPVAKDGITIKTTDDNQVKYTTVKIHNNTDAVECLQFGKSFKISDTEYYYALLETEGGFKAGDVISIAGVFNNADDTKQAAIAVYSDPTKAAIWTTENFINGRTSADDPVAQTFTLTEPAEKLYIGRKGGTATSITDLKVLRGFITISPAPGDIYAAYNAAVDGVADIKKVIINLEKDGAYTISQSLVASASLVINGNGAIIDASSMEGPMITMADGSLADAKAVEAIAVNDATIKGLKKALFYSPGKNYNIAALNISNSVIELAADATTIDFTKGSVAMTVSIDNSTIYAPTATTKSFYSSQSGEKASDYGATEAAPQVFSFTNSTFVNLAPTKNFFTHRQNSQKWLKFVATNNIFVDCGKSGQVIKGMNGGASSKNPQFDIDGNAFNFGGADTSGAEATGDSDEPIKSSIAGIVFFTDAANGDFGGTFAYDTEAAPAKAPGDPSWTLAVKEHYQTIWSSEEPVAITWGAGAFTIAAEKFANAEIGDNLIVKIVDPQVYTNPWDAQVALKSPRDGWPELEGFTNIGTTAPTMVTYVLTGDILAEAKKNGLLIAGNNFKTDCVSIEATSTTGSENSIWIGEQTEHLVLSNYHFANANNFRGVKVNDTIRVKIKEPKWLGIAYNKGWTWTGFAEGDIETKNDWTNPVVDFVIKTEAAAKEMNDKANNNGVIINTGGGAVPLQVELIPYFDVATLNKLEDKEDFIYTNEVVVAAITKKKSATYVYIKDDSGYSLIYDKDGSKTKNLVEGEGKTIQAGWKGQVSIYNGLFEVVPAEPLAVTEAAAKEIEYPEAKTLKVFNANNVNKIYKLTNLTLSKVDGSNFKVKRGTLEIDGYNQFDGVMIGEGLVCDEVIAAVGIYNGNVQLQPIKITVKPFEPVAVNVNGGDITEAIATAREGKNPSTLTINLAKADYTVSAPIVASGDVTINGNGANIDASGLTGPMIQMSTYPSVAGTAVGSVTAYQVGNVELNEINVDNLSQNLFDCNKTNYLLENVTLNKSIIAIKGASNKTIFNFNGGGNTKNLTVSGSTLYADDATTWSNGGFYSSQSGNSVDQLGGTEQKTTIENSTLYNICKGKTTSTRRKDSQKWMTYEVKNCIIVNSGKSGQFLAGLNKGQKGDNSNWIVDNSSFTYDGQDVAATEATKIKDDVMTNTVYGAPMFRKLWASDGTMTGDFTLGVCRQATKQIGDPRWYQIPQITGLQNALQKAAALLDGAQADWQSAPAANEAIEKLSGAYNENAPYLNSYYQEEIDEATLRMEAAIAEFEMVYGSDVTAIKSVDALKADGTWYTINGQRISKPTEKGIYIHNGRKVVVK